MSAAIGWLCPACGAELEPLGVDLNSAENSRGASCARCHRAFARTNGMLDLRVAPEAELAPWPLSHAECSLALGDLARGLPFKATLERLLLELADPPADFLMQLLREARGAWLPLLRARGGRALLVGNALSGASVPLCNAGFEVTLFERSPERLALAFARNEALAAGRTRLALGGDGAHLPFGDASFDLIVQEEGLPSASTGWGHSASELARVCRGELVLTADNRLGYKRGSGRRGVFHVPTPIAYVRRALQPERGDLTLAGYRRRLAFDGFAPARSFALYPHARDFAHVVSLEEPYPSLTVGPMERKNRFKVVGQRLGLFPWLTPSFGFFTARAQMARELPRIERALDHLAQTIGEPRPRIEQFLATRGNTALVQTFVPDANEREPRGRWTLHIPLSPQQRGQIDNHHARLGWIRERFTHLPVPEPLFLGEIEGLYLACERRMPDWTAPQRTGDHAIARNLFADVARDFARLAMEPARAFGEVDFERLLGARFDLVARYAAVPETIERLKQMRAALREELVGLSIPLVLYHADLRSKHVQIDADGHVVGYLDWGSSELSDLPYFDLLHLVAHERKQEAGLTAARAWAIVRERTELRDYERAALDSYAQSMALAPAYCRAIERIYPVLVAAMAEKNWDYSRPRWLARQFGV